METKFKKCRIALDAMGGDLIPDSPVLGGVMALEELKDRAEIYLVGDKQRIYNVLKKHSKSYPENWIINAKDIVEMHDTPTVALRNKPESSLNIAIKMQVEQKADALVSAGNTGAVMAGSTLQIGRIPGISRPTIGTIIPTLIGKTMLFDVGASVDCKPQHLLEYAIMGSVFMQQIYQIKNPKVAILNVGEEKSKGNELSLATYKLLESSNLNFVGNVEGRDILKGEVDIIVCDGFLGNVILKFAEGFLSFLKNIIKDYSKKGILNLIKAGIVKITLKEVMKGFDYQLHGGVPLLGIKGITIIGHGSSTPLAIKNMIKRAVEVYENDVQTKISSALVEYNKKENQR